MTNAASTENATPARIIARLERQSNVTRRGLKHEDSERIVQVLRLRGKAIGIIAERKGKDGHTVKFSVSHEGAAVLAKLLNGVLRGKTKRWRESVQMVWSVAPEPRP